MFIGTMWDELFFFTYITILFLIPNIIKNKHNQQAVFLIYLTSMSAFFISIAGIMPAIAEHYQFGDFNFFRYAFFENRGLLGMSFRNIYENGAEMISSHIVLQEEGTPMSSISWSYVAGIFILWISMFLLCKNRMLFIKVNVLTIAFILFQSLILTPRGGRLFLGGYYWGHLFSICYVLILAVGLNMKDKLLLKRYIYVKRALIILLCIVGGRNSLHLNKTHHMQQLIDQIPTESSFNPFQLTSGHIKKLTWGDVYKVWSLRDNFEKARQKMKEIPNNGYWLYMHLYLHNRYEQVKGENTLWGLKR